MLASLHHSLLEKHHDALKQRVDCIMDVVLLHHSSVQQLVILFSVGELQYWEIGTSFSESDSHCCASIGRPTSLRNVAN
jgi:hypothetical protein